MDLDPIQMEDKAGFPGKIVAGFSRSLVMKNGKPQERFPPASASEEYNGPFQLDFGGCFFLVSRKNLASILGG